MQGKQEGRKGWKGGRREGEKEGRRKYDTKK